MLIDCFMVNGEQHQMVYPEDETPSEIVYQITNSKNEIVLYIDRKWCFTDVMGAFRGNIVHNLDGGCKTNQTYQLWDDSEQIGVLVVDNKFVANPSVVLAKMILGE